MKKLLLIVAVAGLTFGATSCKKERECKCTDSNTGNSVSYKMGKGKMSDQDAECKKRGIGSIDCKLDLI